MGRLFRSQPHWHHWLLERAALLDARMASASMLLGAIIPIAAGLYQWTPIKDACLAQCQTPFRFLMTHGGFPQQCVGLPAAGIAPRSLLRRLLLDSDGAPVRRRRDERAVDCAARVARSAGETHAVGQVGGAHRGRGLYRRRRVDGPLDFGRHRYGRCTSRCTDPAVARCRGSCIGPGASATAPRTYSRVPGRGSRP